MGLHPAIVCLAAMYVVVAALAWILTKAAIRWVVRLGMQDIPGQRSSHVVPTPRGGGVVIATLVLAFAAIAVFLTTGSARWLLAIIIGGGIVAFIGWRDDRKSVPARVRFSIHLAAALVAVGAMWPNFSVSLLPGIRLGGVITIVFMLLFVTWMLNLYNFMDGIDGLAGGQACSAALGIFILSQRHGNTPLALCALVLSAASLGFLFVNWHPAKVFMGDVGSGFIGYLFALLGLWGVTDRVFPFSSILILLTYFIVDASWTLLRRSVRGERIWDAHRDHAYQHAVRVGCFSHAQVSGAVVGVNFMLLLPAAIACERWPIAQWPLVLVAYACTLVIVMKFRGGVRMP